MKRLVLLGEGHGEVFALPILVNRLLQERNAGGVLYLDRDVIRTSPTRLVKWDKVKQQPDLSEWVSRVTLAARRRDVGGVLAVYDGDAKKSSPQAQLKISVPPRLPSSWLLLPLKRALEDFSHSVWFSRVPNTRLG